MLYVPSPQLISIAYWRDMQSWPDYEGAVTEPLDVLLNRLPVDGWDDELGPPNHYAWTRLQPQGIEHFQIVPMRPSETTRILLQ
jgi:hypothetical protein